MGKFAFLLAAALLALAPQVAWSQEKVLRFVPYTDVISIDPVVTGVYVTRNYGYLVYDTLFSYDASYKPQPQMVATHTLSDDKLVHTLVLRDGLNWHDGRPVTAKDCVASIRRWMKRDGLGKILSNSVETLTAKDDKTIEFRLKKPFPALLDALAKVSGVPAFMMPEEVAKKEITDLVTTAVGSGPFKFNKDEWLQGSLLRFTRNPDYVARSEPPSNTSGAKLVKVDAVEWHIIPDALTAAQALANGEVDWVQALSPDVEPILGSNPDVVVQKEGVTYQLQFRPNFLAPPFDNIKVRQAAYHAIRQEDYLNAINADPTYWTVCQSVFACGTPYETKSGAGDLGVTRDVEKAKKLLSESGYAGEPVVILDAVDHPAVHPAAAILAQDLTAIGMNVRVETMNFSSVYQRVTNVEGSRAGSWNLFLTVTSLPDTFFPPSNSLVRAGGLEDSVIGWPNDPQTQELRQAFLSAETDDKRQEIADRLNARAYDQVLYFNAGQYVQADAYSKSLTGIVQAPVPLFWNVEKTAN